MSDDKVVPIREKRGGRKVRAEKMAELERENAELRNRLDMKPRSLDDWELVGNQELRDAMAVRALIAEWNDPIRALIRLGFDPPVKEQGRYSNAERSERTALIERVFKTPGVEAMLASLTRDLEESKPDLIRRQQEIALHGDPDTSVRAFSQLAKIAGWQKTPDTVIDNRRVNLFTLVSGEKGATAEQGALPSAGPEVDFLGHEPGAPMRIDSGGGEIIDAAFKEGTE